MTTVKRASRFWERQSSAIIAVILTGFALFALAIQFVPDVTWQKVLGLVWFLATAASVFALMYRMGRDFRCPDCNGPVGGVLDTDGKAGSPHLRLCKHCDVLWQVGADAD